MEEVVGENEQANVVPVGRLTVNFGVSTISRNGRSIVGI